MIFRGFNHTPIPQPIFWTAPDTVYDVYGSSYSVISSTFYHAWYWGLFHMGRGKCLHVWLAAGAEVSRRGHRAFWEGPLRRSQGGVRGAVSEVGVAPKITKKWARMSILILNPPYCIWLVVWNIFYIFPYIGNKVNNWLIFFRGVETTNQVLYIEYIVMLFKNQKNIWWSWMMIWSLRQLRSVMPPDVEHDKLFGTTNNVNHHFPQSHCHLESIGNPSFKQWFIISFLIQIAMQCLNIFNVVSRFSPSFNSSPLAAGPFWKSESCFRAVRWGFLPTGQKGQVSLGNGLKMASNHKGYIPIVVISIWLWLT